MPRPDAALWPLGRLVASVQAQSDGGLVALGRKWERSVDALTKRWGGEVSPQQLASAEQQIMHAVHTENLDALVNLAVPAFGEAALLDAMREMAAAGAASVVAEAKRQGVQLELPPPMASLRLADWARATARRVADAFAGGLGREALRLFRPGTPAEDVAAGVRAYADGLTDRGVRDALGGELTRAQNLGRLQTYAQPAPAGWTLRMFADETLDENTCKPCREVNGIALPTPEAAALAYGGAGYIHCLGGQRCRGTMIGVWAESGRGGADLWPLAAVLARTYERGKDGKFAPTPDKPKESGGRHRAPEPSPGGMKSDEAIHAAFNYHDHQTGMSVSVPTIREGAGGQRYVDIEIRNAGGDLVGGGTRTVSADGLSINHSSLALHRSVQGQGLATRFNAHAETTYRANGVQKITLSAAHVGRYAWARAGYDFQRPAERTEVGWKANVIAKNYDHATQAKVKALTSDPNWTPLELSAVGWTKGAKTWPGKEIMQHEDFPIWDGVKTL